MSVQYAQQNYDYSQPQMPPPMMGPKPHGMAPPMQYPLTPAPIVEEKRGLRIVRDPTKKSQRVWCAGWSFSWLDCFTENTMKK